MSEIGQLVSDFGFPVVLAVGMIATSVTRMGAQLH